MSTINQDLLNAEIDFVAAQNRTESIKLHLDTEAFIVTLLCVFILLGSVAAFIPTLNLFHDSDLLSLIVTAGALSCLGWGGALALAIWNEKKALTAYERAQAMATAYDLRTGLIGAD